MNFGFIIKECIKECICTLRQPITSAVLVCLTPHSLALPVTANSTTTTITTNVLFHN